MKKIILSTLITTLALMGCASTTLNYSPPSQPEKIANSATVNEPFDIVWDRLVKRLSSDFFVINNIEKNSRLINVSFSTQQPSKYIDCGRTKRTFTNIQGEQLFDYAPADSATYIAQAPNALAFFNVQRNTKLDGRVNIYVAPNGKSTDVSVNAKYVLNINLTTQQLGLPYSSNQIITADFSTKDPYQRQGVDDIKCFAKGNIEKSIIDMAK